MKKCTLCVDRIDNPDLPEIDRIPACVRTCPTGARHFGDLADPASPVSRLVAERGGIDLMPEQGTRPVNKYLPPRDRDVDVLAPLLDPLPRRGRLPRLARPDARPPLMHPAPSIIVFTTLSGLGFGLMAWLGIGAPPPARAARALLALALASAGLLASLLHLGQPRRFLKAFSQWRSSWLSREAVLAVATLAVFALFAALWVLARPAHPLRSACRPRRWRSRPSSRRR